MRDSSFNPINESCSVLGIGVAVKVKCFVDGPLDLFYLDKVTLKIYICNGRGKKETGK